MSGIYQAVTADGTIHSIRIPGTLDENNIGATVVADKEEAEEAKKNKNRYVRKYSYEGPVRISRLVSFEEEPGKRYFIEVERARSLRLFLDGEEIPRHGVCTLLSPHVFEVTSRIDGNHMLTFLSDNSYPDLPREELMASNMASDDTATNWNGLLGYVRIRSEEESEPSLNPENSLPDRSAFVPAPLRAEKTGFTRNGRPLYVRGETSDALHPETAYLPMRKDAWTSIFKQYASYGVNFVRFRSHCPPEAAFSAADEANILMMPELSRDDQREIALTADARAYYRNELRELIRCFGGHPSLAAVGLPFGEDLAFTEELIAIGKELKPDLLFTGSENVASEKADFEIRNYIPVLSEPEKPLLYTGIGPFSILPDLKEIDLFSGALNPEGLVLLEEQIRSEGYGAFWEKYVENSGEAALVRYREGVESALFEESVSGILLEGLQDCPGRQERFSGMLSSHLVPKPYPFAKPEKFRAFFGAVHPLAVWKTHSFLSSEEPEIPVYALNLGNEEETGTLFYEISDGTHTETGEFRDVFTKPSERKPVGTVRLPAAEWKGDGQRVLKVTLRLRYAGNEYNDTAFFYPENVPVCPESVYETAVFDHQVIEILKNGGNVFLTPPVEDAPGPVSQTIEKTHPLFHRFQTEEYTDERWQRMSDKPGFSLPPRVRSIISVLPKNGESGLTSQLFEARVLNGSIMVSALGLKEKIGLPEASALLSDLYDYMGSYEFSPSREISVRELQTILSAK